MQRDFKIGLIVGLVLLIVAMGWISTRPEFGTQARLAQEQSVSYSPAATLPMPSVPPAADSISSIERALQDSQESGERMPIEQAAPIKTNRLFPVYQEKDAPPIAIPPAKPKPIPVPKPKKTESQPKPRYHTVESGQNLSTISKQYYGSSVQWKRILEANENVLKDPNKIRPGMRLRIPE